MSSTTSVQKPGKGRKKITRTACEPCREKRAKCDGEAPCERCKKRSLECHFTQRAWSSKRSLQDDIAALRSRVTKREDLLEALLVPGTGDSLLAMLRSGEVTMEQAGEKIAAARVAIEQKDRSEQRHRRQQQEQLRYRQRLDDRDPGFSPSTGTLRSPATYTSLSDESLSQGFAPSLDDSTPGLMPPPWATPDLDPGASSSRHGSVGQAPSSSFSKMLEDNDAVTMDTIDEMMQQSQQQGFVPSGNLPPAPPPAATMPFTAGGPGGTIPTAQTAPTGARNGSITGVEDGSAPPTVIDPLLWPPPNASDPLGRPWSNTWTGLQSVAPAEVTVPV